MKNSFKKSLMFLMLLLALTFSAVGVTPALADDGVTPPVDAPTVEEPVADAPVVDAPVAEEPVVADAPAMEEPAADAPAEEPTAEGMTVPEILEQLPEDAGLVVLDESGETLSLVSEEATEVLAAGDPYFWDGTQYVGYTTTTCPAVVDVCNVVSSAPIQAAVNAFAASSSATGEIFVAAGNYTENVDIDGSVGNLANLSGLIGEGSDVTTINGYLNAFNLSNAFDLAYFTFTDQVYVATGGDVYMNDVVVDGTTSTGGLIILSDGTVQLDSVASFQSSYDGLYVSATGDINIWDSAFYENTEDGAYLYSDGGNVYVENSQFAYNNMNGLEVDAGGDVTLNQVSAFENSGDGANLYSYAGAAFVNNNTLVGNSGWDLYTDAYYVQICDTVFSNEEIVGCEGFWSEGEADDSEDVPVVIVETAPAVETVSAADLPALTLENLPAPLPATLEDGSSFTFAGGFDASSIEIPEGESAVIAFELPDDIDPENLVILMFIDGAWVELTDFVILSDGSIELTITVAGEIVFGQK